MTIAPAYVIPSEAVKRPDAPGGTRDGGLRKRTRGNVKLVSQALEVALAFDLIDGPAPSQAAALVRRTRAMSV